MRFLVTGGLGFIGSHFVRLLAEENHEIVVVDKMTYAADLDNLSSIPRKSYDMVRADIAGQDLLLQLQPHLGRNFDVAINFAAESHVDRSISDGSIFSRTNTFGVAQLLEIQKSGFIGKFVQVSTDEVYGSNSGEAWTENSPLEPRSPYSASKAGAELLCFSYINTFKQNIVVTRAANNYGPNQSAEKLIPMTIARLLRKELVPIYGSGENLREWVYVTDHVRALYKISTGINAEKVYNIGGVEESNINLVSKIARIMNIDYKFVEFVSDRPGHDFRYSVNDSRMRNEFDWTPNILLEDGLSKVIDWYISNKDWLNRSLEKNSK